VLQVGSMKGLHSLMASQSTIIRHADPSDIDSILSLMLALAEFEGYAEQFVVTKDELKHRLFTKKDFSVLVAEHEQNTVAILVYYTLPFTYDLKPWFYIKELFVDGAYRSKGLGKKLMIGLAEEAKNQGCSKIRWDVLSTNEPAKAFYQSLGAAQDEDWALFSLSSDNISQLVSR